MTTLAKAAAIAGSLASAAAVAVAVMLPVHHAPDASAATAAVTKASGSSGLSSGSAGAAGANGAAGSTSAGSAGSTGTGSSGTGSSGTGSSGTGSSGTGSSGTGSSGTGSSGTGSSGTGSGGTGSSGSSGTGSSGGSTGGTWHGTVHPVIPSFPHLPITLVTAIPSPTGTIGDPDVPCLQGYVWRQAYSGDYVCVVPATRTEAAVDNTAAVSRVQSGGGAYGQYTCIQGYVWRQVVTDDYTCVTPAVRSQAAYDNSQAGNRVALLNLWVSDWTPPGQPTQNCSNGVCTTTSGGWDGPNFQINGDLFNFGPVLLEVRRNDGAVLWSTTVVATSYTGFPGGALYAQTPIGDCSAVPGTTDNDYVIAYDTVSGRWSGKLPIDSDCASF
jgi:hypothetical protein